MTVKQIQHLLAYLGYYSGTVDGIWGKQSAAAATRFQQDYGGLSVDGLAESTEAGSFRGYAGKETGRQLLGSYPLLEPGGISLPLRRKVL